ncbi:hypothetical protein CJ030_MR2G003985 [Morella rubra]|uniref:DUF4220 domain-containing protein n=1 Tax=Morella rubra TaxID=262757 RepID=A0A6A1W9I9_9ROSI|nr:hypothetical protein CJ030_MR2G003985 [Morella rubra]
MDAGNIAPPPSNDSLLTNEEFQLLKIEAYVTVTALLIGFLVVFGSLRRRSRFTFLHFSLMAASALSANLISYTVGLMQSVPFYNDLLPVWMMFLLIFLRIDDLTSTHVSLEVGDDEDQNKHNIIEKVQYVFLGVWMVVIAVGTRFFVPLILLFILAFFRSGQKRTGLVRSTRLLEDFMADEHELSNEEVVDPSCMKGYNYLVKGDKEKNARVTPPSYRKQLEITSDVITIEKIWQCKGRLLTSAGDPDWRLKDVCLSYALCRLLYRRFLGYSCAESSQVKTWKFVRYGLLPREGDDHERTFRVIEVELEFLYDFVYTNYPVLFAKGISVLSKTIEFFVVLLSCVILAKALKKKPPQGNVDIHLDVDVPVTIVVIVAILFMEIVQYLFIIFSNWAKVQLVCYYVGNPSLQKNKIMEIILQFLCQRKPFKPWERKLGQYSLLESFNHNPSILLYNRFTSLVDKPRKGQKESTRIKLPVEVKKAIVRSLRTNGQRLNNGEASLQRNGVENELSWACKLETQTHVIMVWHIATSLLEIATSSKSISTVERQANQQIRESEQFIVATKLSKYCAYLVAFASRLLPDPAHITQFIFDQVVLEARDVLKGCKSLDSRSQKIMTLSEGDDQAKTFFERGAILAKHLNRIEDNGRRWKILADFWAATMLFVAPSDDIAAHADRLAKGGEFVTHLWALLSHAGILERDSDQAGSAAENCIP